MMTSRLGRSALLACCLAAAGWRLAPAAAPRPAEVKAADAVPVFGVVARSLEHAGDYENPYRDLAPEVQWTGPGGRRRTAPLFWDGGRTWRLRFSPDQPGVWRWRVRSRDAGLNGRQGEVRATPSDLAGSIQPMNGHPEHVQRQNGQPFWLFGDTAWALYTDNADERHTRAEVEHYLDVRARQGFNAVHSMLLSEAGWGNAGGPPFFDIARERINPGYWREVDERVRSVNRRGMIAGLVLAWGDKRGVEPYAWGRFSDMEARRRYARYIAARYSAFNVYYLVAGEWHAEIRANPDAGEAAIRKMFVDIGDALYDADPHRRMAAIHPMTAEGSVREFAGARWMAFADYQQNYRRLHERILLSRRGSGPVVNGEYAYYLRDRDGDGLTDKPNSATIDDIRHATWDIVLAGGYCVTGFGTTYFGGNRDPGPFDVDAGKNDVWEEQAGHVMRLMRSLTWWALAPADEALEADAARGEDGARRIERGGRSARTIKPPEVAYWLLADPGRTYLAYARGHEGPYTLRLGRAAAGRYRVRRYDPRRGRFEEAGVQTIPAAYRFTTPDRRDWLVLLERR